MAETTGDSGLIERLSRAMQEAARSAISDDEEEGEVPRHGLTQPAMDRLPRELCTEECTCVVCQEDLRVGDLCISLPCGHTFHESCLLHWVRRRNSCPTCRRQASPDEPPRETRPTSPPQTRVRVGITVSQVIVSPPEATVMFNLWTGMQLETTWSIFTPMRDLFAFLTRLSACRSVDNLQMRFLVGRTMHMYKLSESMLSLGRTLAQLGGSNALYIIHVETCAQ